MNIDILKAILGTDKILTYQARLVRTIRASHNGMKQTTMGVIAISKEEQDELGNGLDWERMDCDIIIIPRKQFSCPENLKNARLDQATMGLANDKAWKEIK